MPFVKSGESFAVWGECRARADRASWLLLYFLDRRSSIRSPCHLLVPAVGAFVRAVRTADSQLLLMPY